MSDWQEFLKPTVVKPEMRKKILKGKLDSHSAKSKLVSIFGCIPNSVWDVRYMDKLDMTERGQHAIAEEKYRNDTLKVFDNSTRNQNIRNKGAISIFPIQILNQLLEFYTEPGDVFFDPFAGHNSRMESSFRKNRPYIGWDCSIEFMKFNEEVKKKLIKEKPNGTPIKLVLGDSRNIDEPDNSVDFIFSSPPYWCLVPDTKIFTDVGIKEIQDLIPGDKVLTHKGNMKEVIGVSDREIEEDILKLSIKNNSETLKLTKNHKTLAIKTKNCPYFNKRKQMCRSDCSYLRTGKWNFKKCGNFYKKYAPSFILPTKLESGDLLCYPINRDETNTSYFELERKKSFNQYISNINNTILINGDFCRLVGYYIAEGCSSKSDITFTFNSNEREYIEDVKHLLNKAFNFTHIKEYTYGNTTHIKCYSTVVATWFKENCAIYSQNKRIPNFLMSEPLFKQKQLLIGLFRGDGCSYSEGFNYTTVSPTLAEQIKQLLHRFNIVPSYRKTKRGQGTIMGRPTYRFDKHSLNIVDMDNIRKLSNILDVAHPKETSKRNDTSAAFILGDYVCYPIKDIKETSYKGLVYNCEVKDDNSYTTTVCNVHNCLEWYGDEPEQLSNLSYEDFIRDMTVIYKQCFRVLKPGKFCIINVNDFRKDSKYYDYHCDTIKALKEAGFIHFDNIIMKYRQAMRQCFPNQILEEKLMPKVFEYIIVCFKPDPNKKGAFPWLE